MAPMLGGPFHIWNDLAWRPGLRLQRRAGSDRFRILGIVGENAVLDEKGAKALWNALPTEKYEHVVVLFHGLARTPRSMRKLQMKLTNQGLLVANLGYAASVQSVEDSIEVAEQVIASIACKSLSFVTHSMGGVLVQQVLNRRPDLCARTTQVLMLAPPCHPSSVARLTQGWPLVSTLVGRPVAAFARGMMPDSAPVRTVVLAGTAPIPNPLIPSPNDGIVTVEETRFAAAEAHEVISAVHTTIMNHPRVYARASTV